MQDKKFYTQLVERYVDNMATDDELEVFFHLLKQGELDEFLTESMDKNAILQEGSDKPYRSRMLLMRRTVAAAAAVIIIVGAAGYFLLNNSKSNKVSAGNDFTHKDARKNDIAAPFKNKAILTLADGSTILLDSASNGSLTKAGNVNVLKLSDGQIKYVAGSGAVSVPSQEGQVKYNTLTVPRGSKPMQLQLVDGSTVWLNVASSITYPTAFVGKERKITMSGEAYFEVAKNPAVPFCVYHDGIKVSVLGTHFNVNTYADEKEIKVTLLEGAVDVASEAKHSLLKPGQQALISGENIQVAQSVDVDEVMAWKNGQFYFNAAELRMIMRQVEKYYNVEVEFRDNVPYLFVAKISRQVTVSEFLKKLELTNLVHFKIEGNKIIVTR